MLIKLLFLFPFFLLSFLSSFLPFFLTSFPHSNVCVYMQLICIEVRRQVAGADSLSPLYGLPIYNSSCLLRSNNLCPLHKLTELKSTF